MTPPINRLQKALIVKRLANNKLHVNFVTEPLEKTWILRKWCLAWANFIGNSTVSSTADPQADANVYVNYATFKEKTKLDIGAFTHREEERKDLKQRFNDIAQQCDWCFAQSETTLKLLPAIKSSLLQPGIGIEEKYYRSNIKVGIIGRSYDYSNRKRFDWVENLKNLKLPYFEFVFSEGKFTDDEMYGFFKSLDYVLITSSIEGGPMIVPEALAMGKPVIAPFDVGWCNSYSTLKFNTYEDLVTIFKGLLPPDKNAWLTGAKIIMDKISELRNKA